MVQPIRSVAAPASRLAFDVAVLVFAVWTLLCHAVVFLGGSARHLFTLAAVTCFVAALALPAWTWRHGLAALRNVLGDPVDVVSLEDERFDRIVRAWVAMGGLAVVLVHRSLRDGWSTWSACLVLAVAYGVVLFRHPWTSGEARPPVHPRAAEVLLWVLVAVSALITLSLHRDNSDDSFYVNLAVSAVDYPDLRLFGQDMLHGRVEPPPAMYHVTSFELLGGLLSAATGLPALLVVHMVLGTLGGMAIPLGVARLLRVLDPHRWFLLVPLTLTLYLFDGTSQFNFSMHGYARIYQGKAILWSVMLPAVVAYAISFAARPTRLRFALLCAAQIAGIGLSSTGLWLMPLAASVGLAVPLRVDRRSLRALLIGAASSIYVVAVAWWVRTRLLGSHSAQAGEAVKSVVESAEGAGFERIGWSFKHVFGGWPVASAYVAIVLAALALAPNRLSRRYLTAFCVVLTGVLLNPWLFDFLAKNLLGRSTFDRALWLLPLPVAVTFAAGAFIPRIERGERKLVLGLVAACVLLGIFYERVPHRTNLGHLRFPPGPKVQHPEYETVQRITAALPPGSYVVAPRKVAVHLSLVHGFLRPVIAKKEFFSGEERARRLRLRDAVSHRSKEPIEGERAAWLRSELDHFEVRGIVGTRHSESARGLKQVLESAGFRYLGSVAPYRIWVRDVR